MVEPVRALGGSGQGEAPRRRTGRRFRVVVVPFPVADRCGVRSPGMGVNGAAGDGRVNVVEMHAPASLTRGRTTTIEVTLDSFDGSDLGQLGYAATIAGVETRHGFPTGVIQRLLPQLPTVFDIPVNPSASLPPGPTSLRIEVLAGSSPQRWRRSI